MMYRSTQRTMGQRTWGWAAAGLVIFLAGCASDQDILVGGHYGRGEIFSGSYATALYGKGNPDNPNHLEAVLLEGTLEKPVRALHIRMHWKPRAGRTPLDEQATNATISYMVFEEGGVGVWEGGGFLMPLGKPGTSLRGDLRHATLRLVDASSGFSTQSGSEGAVGSFMAQHDEPGMQNLLRGLQQEMTRRLGYPRVAAQ